jgi:hypothetical protein
MPIKTLATILLGLLLATIYALAIAGNRHSRASLHNFLPSASLISSAHAAEAYRPAKMDPARTKISPEHSGPIAHPRTTFFIQIQKELPPPCGPNGRGCKAYR